MPDGDTKAMDAARDADHRRPRDGDCRDLVTGCTDAAQRRVVIRLAHDLTCDSLADEEKGHQGGKGSEDQQGHDLEVDSPLGAGRRCPDSVRIAGAREDPTLSYGPGGRRECRPVGRAVSQTHAEN